MVNQVLFWAGFGLATRIWSLGIQMQPMVQRNVRFMLVYPAYAGVGAGFGYWLQGVEKRQDRIIDELKVKLREKQLRVLAREAAATIDSN